MRKAIIATLSVLIVLLFIACNTRVNYNKYLIAIDSLIVQQPDTALSMLEAFPTNSLQTQADSAYYGLLMTEARDKNYIIQTNDSLIQSALTYYNGTNDIEKRARAHYYSGCVYRDSQRRTESMTQYLIAKPLAEKAGERRLLSLIYLNIGYLYYSQNLNTQADSSYQLAQQIGIQLKDSVLQAEVLSRRGLIRMEKGEEFYPEAEKMMLKALAIVQKQSNIQLKENVFSSLCQLYNWMENGEKAIEFAKQNLGVQKDRTTCYKAFELLGSAYYLILQYDSARHYLQKSLFTTDYATKAGAHVSSRHSQRARRLSYFLRDGTQLLCLFGQHAEVQTARCHCLRRTRDAKQQAKHNQQTHPLLYHKYINNHINPHCSCNHPIL